jgi:zinc D-Ala-D-Ala carboxypeptidase
MKLTKNFSLEEMTKSQTALRKGLDNAPSPHHIVHLELLCEHVLQPIRDHFDRPVTITSGYRSPELCAAIGSKITSQHTKGQAADFEIPGVSNMEVAEYIRDNLDFDQLILECYTGGNTGWIHCSYVHEPRKDVLTYDRDNGYRKGLIA